MRLLNLFTGQANPRRNSTRRKTAHGAGLGHRLCRVEPLEQRMLLSVASPAHEPFRVGLWTPELIEDLGAFVESQQWPEVLGDVDPYLVRELVHFPLSTDARGGYRTIVKMEPIGQYTVEEAIAALTELDLVDYARLESESVIQFGPHSQAAFDAMSRTAEPGQTSFHICGEVAPVRRVPVEMRVTVWTEERIPDIGVWVDAQSWPEALGPVDGDSVEQLISIPVRSDPRGGYFTVFTMPVFGEVAALDQLQFIEYARLESECVVQYGPRSQELIDAITTGYSDEQAELFWEPVAGPGEPADDSQAVELATTDSYDDDGSRALLDVLDPHLVLTYREYEQFIEQGGDPSLFTPSNSWIGVVDGRVRVEVHTTEAVFWEDELDVLGEDVVRVENTAFIEQFEGVGMEVTLMRPRELFGHLPIDALDDLAQVPGIRRVDAFCPHLPSDRFPSGTLAEVLDADLLQVYQEFEAYKAIHQQGYDILEFRTSNPRVRINDGRVSVDVVSVEPVVSEQVIDGALVEVTDTAFLRRLSGGGMWKTKTAEFLVSGTVPVDDLECLAGVAGVRLITPAGRGAKEVDDAPAAPDEPIDDRTGVILPWERIVIGDPGGLVILPVEPIRIGWPVELIPPIDGISLPESNPDTPDPLPVTEPEPSEIVPADPYDDGSDSLGAGGANLSGSQLELAGWLASLDRANSPSRDNAKDDVRSLNAQLLLVGAWDQ